jgi:hypothetical protein
VPFGFIDNGLDDYAEKDDNGDLWVSGRESMYPFDNLNYDWGSKL